MLGERNSLIQGERGWCGVVKGVWFMYGILGDGQMETRRKIVSLAFERSDCRRQKIAAETYCDRTLNSEQTRGHQRQWATGVLLTFDTSAAPSSPPLSAFLAQPLWPSTSARKEGIATLLR